MGGQTSCAVPLGRAWYCKLWYLRSARVLWWRVGSWQRIANMCRSSSRTVSFTFSRTRALVSAWWASECLTRILTSYHTWIGFCLCFYPVLGRSTFSGEFFPIVAQFRGKCKSSQSAPAVEIWLADLDPNDCEEVQTTWFRTSCSPSQLWVLGKAEKVNLSYEISILLSMCGQI